MGALNSLTPSASWFRVDDESTVGAARRAVVELAQALELGENRAADAAIIATELSSNLVKHARDGMLLVRPVRLGEGAGVEIVSLDSGPGMSDLAEMHRDGHSTTGTLGIGLGAVARLASWYDVYSQPGQGTTTVAQIWRDLPAEIAWAAGITRPLSGEPVSGDTFAHRVSSGRYQMMLCDGLGHGPLAAAASETAFSVFHAAPSEPPSALVERLHRSMSHTRGAALAVAEIDLSAGLVYFSGLGNIAGVVVTGDEQRSMVCLPGIAGHGRATVRQFQYPYAPGALVLMHSDGVTGKWNLGAYPGLLGKPVLLVAATILRDAGIRRDDACVLAARVT
jgi:anti-sigma regulatory factor (Ser/Thr protein kinase)